MKKLSVYEVKKQIIKAAIDMGENPCEFLAFASIETGGTFNNTVVSKSGTFVGVMQLSNGAGGVKGEDRKNPYKATIGAIKYMRSNKDQIIEKIGSNNWHPSFMYLSHQQGATGFSTTWKEQNLPISKATYRSNILNNAPVKFNYVYEFIKFWANKFDNLIKQCSIECLTTVNQLGEYSKNDKSEDVIVSNIKEDDNNIVVNGCLYKTRYGVKAGEYKNNYKRNFFNVNIA